LARIRNNHCAKGALDTALCELRAQAAGRTLFEAERGPRERLEVAYILGIDSLETMLSEAEAVYDRGVRVIGRGLWYISAAHTETDIDQAIDTAHDVLRTL
jgi:L-alanine-DL-glutamate epimerase-like enolase superfamily enzyme